MDGDRRGRREDLTETLASHVLAHGLAEASLRSLAKAADTSDRMLLYYFTDKADLVEAVLSCLARRLTPLLVSLAAPERLDAPRLERRMRQLFSSPQLEPFGDMFCELALLANRGDRKARPFAERMGRSLHGWLMGQLAGRPGDSTTDAARLMVAQFGRQVLRAAQLSDIIDIAEKA